MVVDIFETDPDFINEMGTKWWVDKDLTQYAQKPDSSGTSLDVVVFLIEEINGRRTRVIVSNNQTILDEDSSLEGISLKIDLLKFLKRTDEIY